MIEQELTQEEKERLEVVNYLNQLQMLIFQSDAIAEIDWIYNNDVKMLMKRLEQAILKRHGKNIRNMWNAEGADMHTVTRILEDYQREIAQVKYHKLPQLTQFILDNPELKEI